jgi:hypothetical protein
MMRRLCHQAPSVDITKLGTELWKRNLGHGPKRGSGPNLHRSHSRIQILDRFALGKFGIFLPRGSEQQVRHL